VVVAEHRDNMTAQRMALQSAGRFARLPVKPSSTPSAFNPLATSTGDASGAVAPPHLIAIQCPRAVLFFAKHYGLGCVPSLPLSSGLSSAMEQQLPLEGSQPVHWLTPVRILVHHASSNICLPGLSALVPKTGSAGRDLVAGHGARRAVFLSGVVG
jgi:hypothetical protein